MHGYLEWLAAGLIFLLILGAYDARAAAVDRDGHWRNVRCESPRQNAFLPAPPSRTCMPASDSSAGSLPGGHDQRKAI